MRFSYAKAPFFSEHSRFFETAYQGSWHKLIDLTNEITAYLLQVFGIKTKLYFSSRMNPKGRKDELVLNLCRELGAKVYLSGPLGRNHLRQQLFEEQGITVRYDDYQHPVYSQAHPGFEPYMAAVDISC